MTKITPTFRIQEDEYGDLKTFLIIEWFYRGHKGGIKLDINKMQTEK
jgi:hypothetical protein